MLTGVWRLEILRHGKKPAGPPPLSLLLEAMQYGRTVCAIITIRKADVDSSGKGNSKGFFPCSLPWQPSSCLAVPQSFSEREENKMEARSTTKGIQVEKTRESSCLGPVKIPRWGQRARKGHWSFLHWKKHCVGRHKPTRRLTFQPKGGTTVVLGQLQSVSELEFPYLLSDMSFCSNYLLGDQMVSCI